MIKFVLEKRLHTGEEDIFCPTIYCDICEAPLYGLMGAAVWFWDGTEKPGRIWFACKGRCHCALDLHLEGPGKHAPWIELSAFINQLKNNTERNPAREAREAALFTLHDRQRAPHG